jgi:hypothetical protein
VEIHESARKHGILDEDMLHAIENAMAIEDRDDDTRLYLGAAGNGNLLEVVSIRRADDTELIIHAMAMRSGYSRLLPEEYI